MIEVGPWIGPKGKVCPESSVVSPGWYAGQREITALSGAKGWDKPPIRVKLLSY